MSVTSRNDHATVYFIGSTPPELASSGNWLQAGFDELHNSKRSRVKQTAAAAYLLLTVLVSSLHAQDLPDAPEATQGSPIPVITGFMSYQTNIGHGTFDLNPEFDPVVLLPIGRKVLLQAEFDMSLDVARTSGTWGPAAVDHGFDYLQATYFAHPNLSLVAGRYLVPFGIYRERMHPLWIRYLQAEPISFTLNATSGNGPMVRGEAHLSHDADVTYSAYYSAADSTAILQSDRQAGFRTSLVLPERHMEIWNLLQPYDG